MFSDHLNPMVNMGAIAMCTLIKGKDYEERFRRLLDLTRQLAGDQEIDLDQQVYLSEKRTGNKNRALAFLLKTYGMIEDDVEQVLDCYFKACSISVNSKDLAHIGFVVAQPWEAASDRGADLPQPVCHLCQRHFDDLWDVRRLRRFRGQCRRAGQKWSGRRHYGCGAHRMGIGIFSPGLMERETAWQVLRCWRSCLSGCI